MVCIMYNVGVWTIFYVPLTVKIVAIGGTKGKNINSYNTLLTHYAVIMWARDLEPIGRASLSL